MAIEVFRSIRELEKLKAYIIPIAFISLLLGLFTLGLWNQIANPPLVLRHVEGTASGNYGMESSRGTESRIEVTFDDGRKIYFMAEGFPYVKNGRILLEMSTKKKTGGEYYRAIRYIKKTK